MHQARTPSKVPRGDLPSRFCCLVAVLVLLPWISSCGGGNVTFHYPDELIDFQPSSFSMPDVYLGVIGDLRPTAQKTGQGRFVGLTYPSDENWNQPVTTLYRNSLAQDLNQTHLVTLVPLQAQADYIVEADILSFSCRLQRSVLALLLPIGIGMGIGMALGEDSSDRLKVGIAASVAGLLAIPLPVQHRAEAQVRLRLRNPEGNVVWEKTCMGEVKERINLSATARDDQKLVDRFLTKALKKCNACLLGQLRQDVLLAGS